MLSCVACLHDSFVVFRSSRFFPRLHLNYISFTSFRLILGRDCGFTNTAGVELHRVSIQTCEHKGMYPQVSTIIVKLRNPSFRVALCSYRRSGVFFLLIFLQSYLFFLGLDLFDPLSLLAFSALLDISVWSFQ